MTLAAHLQAIEAALNDADLPPCCDVAISPGRFDASELGRTSFRGPALRVAFLGAPRTTPLADTSRRYGCAFAVFILTEGRNRAIEGLDLTELVAEVVELNRFSHARVGIPDSIRLDTLYSGDVDDKGVSIFSVSWTQAMRIGASVGSGTASLDAAVPDSERELTEHFELIQEPGLDD
ncbi:hypothetical protein [uncultured Tateyamaria sp.]|uniref:hypothetical protein n=1 Tax=uncultured Tateyamaria sp. TaxID=455651 RepID=UPI00261272E6|nr:hypothetical protein [uncultured Tateyamaria sp.]